MRRPAACAGGGAARRAPPAARSLLRLVLDLLLVHLQVLLGLVLLVAEVEQRDHEVRRGAALRDAQDLVRERGQQRGGRHADERAELLQARLDGEVDDPADDDDLEQVLGRLDRGARAEEVLEALRGVELLEVRLERAASRASQPTCRTLIATPATTQANAIGSMASRPGRTICPARSPDPALGHDARVGHQRQRAAHRRGRSAPRSSGRWPA